MFPDHAHFSVHPALPATTAFGDEGAANHTRLASAFGERGVHLFVYGRVAQDPDALRPRRFVARQSLEASRAVARVGHLAMSRAVFAQQRPEVIDAGVFHNDVIAVGHRRTLLFHERALLRSDDVLSELRTHVPDAVFVRVDNAEGLGRRRGPELPVQLATREREPR